MKRRTSVLRVASAVVAVVAMSVACSDSPGDRSRRQTPPSLPAGVEVIRPIQLTKEARIPENDPALDHVEVMTDRLVFYYRASPEIPLNADNVVAGAAGGGYLRRLTTVTRASDSTVEAVTSPAYVTDFILDGAFRVRAEPAVGDWAEGVAGSSKQALEQQLQAFTPTTKSGFTCGATIGNQLEVTPALNVDLDFELDVDISAQLVPPKGQLVHALFLATGSVETGFEASNVVPVGLNCSIDLIQVLREHLGKPEALKWNLKPMTFFVGPVPVVISHALEPTASLQASGQLDSAVKLHSSASLKLTMGAEYRDGEWTGIWEPQRQATLKAVVPDEDGNLSLTATLSAGISYQALLWDLAGPKFDVAATVDSTLESDPLLCTWKSTVGVAAGLGIGAAVQAPLVDWTVAEYTQTFQLAREQLGQAEGVRSGCEDAGPGDPDGGTATKLGAACVSDGECGPGLSCVRHDSGQFLGGGPAKGYCTIPCSDDATCSILANGALCATTFGYCFQGCDTQDPSGCHSRPEVECVPYAAKSLCVPKCTSDYECGLLLCSSDGLCRP